MKYRLRRASISKIFCMLRGACTQHVRDKARRRNDGGSATFSLRRLHHRSCCSSIGACRCYSGGSVAACRRSAMQQPHQRLQLVALRHSAKRFYRRAQICFFFCNAAACRLLLHLARRARRERCRVAATATHGHVRIFASDHFNASAVCGSLGEMRRLEAQLADGCHFLHALGEWNERSDGAEQSMGGSMQHLNAFVTLIYYYLSEVD